MIYKNVEFDDFTKGDDGKTWSQICKHCAEKHGVFENELCKGDGSKLAIICGIKDCYNEAVYYIDFNDEILED